MSPLPPSLLLYLTSYPQPVFILPAQQLHDALITRSTIGASAPHTPATSTTGSNSAEGILEGAFGDTRSGGDPTSFLEGGEQKPHHPSRTAEGAVASMLAQLASASLHSSSLAHSRATERLASSVAQKKENEGWGSLQKPGRHELGLGVGLRELVRPVWGNEGWRGLGGEGGVMEVMGKEDLVRFLGVLGEVVGEIGGRGGEGEERGEGDAKGVLRGVEVRGKGKEKGKRTLDLVATLSAEFDSVIVTTILYSPPEPPPPPPPPRPPLAPFHRNSSTTTTSTLNHNSSTSTIHAPTSTSKPRSRSSSSSSSQSLLIPSHSSPILPSTSPTKPFQELVGIPLSTPGFNPPLDFTNSFIPESSRRRGKKPKGRKRSKEIDLAEDDESESPFEEGRSIPLSLRGRGEDEVFMNVLSKSCMGRLILGFDWEGSSLGRIGGWGKELKCLVGFMLNSPFRTSIWHGDDQTLLYNDEYASMAGQKHPGLLGKAGSEGWSELWDTIGPLSARVMKGETVSYFDNYLPMTRNGYLEETYHIWSFIPYYSTKETAKVAGYLNLSFETTARVIAERRLGTIRDLVVLTSGCRALTEYCEKMMHVLSLNPRDLPFAILYTCEQPNVTLGRRTGSDSGTGTGSRSKRTFDGATTTGRDTSGGNTANVRLNLQQTIGVPPNHPSCPPTLVLKIDLQSTSQISSQSSSTSSASGTQSSTHTSDPQSWPFQEACLTRKPVFISELAGRAKGFEGRGFEEGAKNAVCIPVVEEDESVPRGFLVVGINPRRPWNEVFATFLHLLSRHIAAGMAAVTATEAEARRSEELIALDKAKTNFFSSVSHELRTPLTLILGPLDDVLSAKNTLKQDDRDRLVVVQRHGQRLLNMVNSLLDYTRVEAGRSTITYRPVEISALTADLASLFRSSVERGGISYVVECPPDPVEGRHVYLAVELWEKIVFNLLINAYKYTLTGTITIRCRYTPKEVITEVIDTGCGIEEKELGSIFERFHRVESTARSREGTGIGLALVLELVKALGGTIAVESETGVGSTFSVRLPRGSAHLPAGQVVSELAPVAPLPQRARQNISILDEAASWRLDSGNSDLPILSPSASNHSSGDDHFLVGADLLDLKNQMVLLVDDNDDLRAYVASCLAKAYTVVQMSNGSAALDYALRHPPNLIVTDVMMDKLDGYGLLAALRDNPSTALIPVIFLSAQAGAEARVDALNQGADDYLVKPFQSRELLARVNVHLQLGKMRMELEKRVEERTRALVESEIRYRSLADRYSTLSLLSPIGICLFSEIGTMTYANPRWYEMSGYPANAPLSKWRESVFPEDVQHTEVAWKEMLTHPDAPGVKSMEFRWKKGNWTQFEIRPFSENGKNRGWVGGFTDVSLSKEVEALRLQTIEQRVAEAEENRRQQELYIDMASHELRNPLSGVWQNAEVVGNSLERVTAFIEDVASGEYDHDEIEDILGEMKENAEAIESIIVCASHQGRIADDIISISKLNMSLLSITPQNFHVATKMAETLKMVETECQQKQIALSINQRPSLSELGAQWVVADSTRLAQIVLNFLTNAVKYTSGAAERSVTLHLEAFSEPPPTSLHAMRVTNAVKPIATPENGIWLVIGVEDSGKGLSQEEMRKLFSRFSQAHPRSDQYSGSGLGLFVSKQLVELHQGFIEVESVPGHGSVFKCVIPAPRGAPPPAGSPALVIPSLGISTNSRKRPMSASASVRASPNLPASPGSTAVPPTFLSPTSSSSSVPTIKSAATRGKGPMHVLVVEDNLINQRVIARQLKLAKCRVTLASNGQEALDILEGQLNETEDPIHVILMDIEMPIMDGMTAIKILRQREADGVVPLRFGVIAVTGNARAAQVEMCHQAGFDDVSIKPYRIKELLETVEKVTGRPIILSSDS